jgi:hypothetical protein
MMFEPVLQGLLTVLSMVTAATAVVGVIAPRRLTTDPARLEAIRAHLIFLAASSFLLLAALWGGFVAEGAERGTVGALFLGGACYFGAFDLWDSVRREVTPHAYTRWVELLLAILLGAWLQHRFAEILARVRR